MAQSVAESADIDAKIAAVNQSIAEIERQLGPRPTAVSSALLKNPNITEIDGVAISDLKALETSQSKEAVRNSNDKTNDLLAA